MELRARFEDLYGRRPAGIWGAPGRVNLIGDHTDYNDGFVLPFALDRRAYAAVALRTDDVVRCASLQRNGEVVATSLGELARGTGTSWASYVLGVAWALAERGVETSGFDLLLDSQVPVGAGLSSSAAVETATVLALTELLGTSLQPLDLALVAHRAETAFVGAPVGVMDQVASACAVDGHALLLDCRSLEMTHVAFSPERLGCALLVIDTRVKHQNTDGAYAERRAACLRAAAELGLDALRDAAPEQVVDRPRARHVVSECARVLAAADALDAHDAESLGRLMLGSHASLRDDFEVSTPELDAFVETTRENGSLGARLTGGGFGGCAIVLLPAPETEALEASVRRKFHDERFEEPAFYDFQPSHGAEVVG